MRVILYTYDLNRIGGIETAFYNLAGYMKTKGIDVAVRYGKCDPDMKKKFERAGIDIKKETSEMCDILIVGGIFRRPRLIKGKFTIQQAHADWSDSFWNGAGSAIAAIAKASKTVDVFAPVSLSAGEFVMKVTDVPVMLMLNLAPEYKPIKRVKHDGLVFSAFTRMTEEKGLKNYIAFKDRVLELGVKAEFRVYTNGEAPAGWVKHEPVDDITKELADVDFVVSLADTESFGYTIAEANASGIPCVIKRSNSTEEFYDNTDNLILDDVVNFDKKDLRRKISSYCLRENSELNIDRWLDSFDSATNHKCIIRSMKRFNDLNEKKLRYRGDTFIATNERAKELSKLGLVEVLR